MSLNQIFASLQSYNLFIAIGFALLPLITFGAARALLKFGRIIGCSWFLSVIIHFSIITGFGMLLITAYLLFFTGMNLFTQVDFVLFFFPVVSMFVTLRVIRKVMSFDSIPGFGRLNALVVVTILSFILVLLLYKMRFFVGIFMRFEQFLIIFVVFFILFKLALRKLKR